MRHDALLDRMAMMDRFARLMFDELDGAWVSEPACT
jgi:hypothetical protein